MEKRPKTLLPPFTEESGVEPAVHLLALTMVCREIRGQCTQLFYASNDFIFTPSSMSNPLLYKDKFERLVGATNTRAIRSATIFLRSESCVTIDVSHRWPAAVWTTYVKNMYRRAKADRSLKFYVEFEYQHFLLVGRLPAETKILGWEFNLQAMKTSCKAALSEVTEVFSRPKTKPEAYSLVRIIALLRMWKRHFSVDSMLTPPRRMGIMRSADRNKMVSYNSGGEPFQET